MKTQLNALIAAQNLLNVARELLGVASEQLDNRSPYGFCYCSVKPAEQNVMAALAAVNQAITTMQGDET